MVQETRNFNDNCRDKVFYLIDLVEQLETMINFLYYERERIKKLTAEIKKIHKKLKVEESIEKSTTVSYPFPLISETSESALKTSIIFFQFSVLEAIVSVLSELTVQINGRTYIEPRVTLSQSEIDFISECTTYYDPNKNKVVQRTTYKSIEERIIQVPELFAKMMKIDFKISKNDGHWNKFKELKKLRDSLTHPKSTKTIIDDKLIFDGSTLVYWLVENYFNLMRPTLFNNDLKHYEQIESSTFKLLNVCYWTTGKLFDINPYVEKHNKIKFNAK